MAREDLAWYRRLADRWRPGSEASSIHDFSMDDRELSYEEVAGFWRGLVRDGQEPTLRERISLYVHVVLCRAKCRYCHCASRPLRRADEREQLVRAILSEAERVAPLLEGVTCLNASVGGGTPNILEPSQLERLLEGVFSRFRVQADGQRSIEFHPSLTTRDKLRVARLHFNRISFGVETHTAEILRAFARDQDSAGVSRALEQARAAGFEEVNADHIFLSGESPRSWRSSIELTAAMRPTMITLFRYRPGEFGGPGQQNVLQPGSGLEVGGRMSFRDAWDVFAEVCDSHGYAVQPGAWFPQQLAYEARIRDRPCPWPVDVQYSQDPLNDASILGLGPQARSTCRGRAVYVNEATIDADGRFDACYQGARRTREDDMRAYLLAHLSMGVGVDAAAFASLYQRSIAETFPSELALLEELGSMTIEDDSITWRTQAPLEAKVAALILGGRRAARALKASLEARATKQHPSRPLPSHVQPGPLGATGWSLKAPSGSTSTWALLEGPDGETLPVRLERADEKSRSFRAANGWMVSYKGDVLPPGAESALDELLARGGAEEP